MLATTHNHQQTFIIAGFGSVKDLQCFDRVIVWERPVKPSNCEVYKYHAKITTKGGDETTLSMNQSFLILDKEKTTGLDKLSGTLDFEVSKSQTMKQHRCGYGINIRVCSYLLLSQC